MIGCKRTTGDASESLETPEKTLGTKRFGNSKAPAKTLVSPKDMGQAPAIEEDLEHVEACQSSKQCPRCYFLRNKEVLEEATPVKYFKSSSWLEARIVDGVWGVGCLVCAAAGMQTDFSTFSIRSYLHMGNFKRHGATSQHQKALNLLNLDNAKTDQKLAPDLSEWKLILDHRRGVASLSFSLSVEQLGKRFKITKMQWCLAEAAIGTWSGASCAKLAPLLCRRMPGKTNCWQLANQKTICMLCEATTQNVYCILYQISRVMLCGGVRSSKMRVR
jgi:hypothetical protein